MSKPFKLSAVLFGHSLDVRSLVTTPDNSIVSGSRDRTAKFWKSNVFNTGYTDTITYTDQKNFVGAVLYLPPCNEHPDGLVVTGGNDNVILVYKPGEPFATLTYREHTNTVCCLSNGSDPYTFLSGSWDCSAKFWDVRIPEKSTVTFSGHTASIWSVVELSSGNVATASADKSIGIWMKNGQRFRNVTGHSDCVRGVLDFPDLNYFLSVSNDASIKMWSYDGDNLDTFYGHNNYIYSIARNKANGPNSFVTSDEDRTVRVWQDGANIQEIMLPAQSIWTVACLNNGDVVTGSSDGVIRIFTQNESRYASEDVLKTFEEEVNAVKKQACQEIGGYKVSDLPGKEALYDPGKTPGQMKMIRESGGVVAYTWVEDGENGHWDKVGDVLGANDKANEGKTMFEGQAYDFVFSVDVEDGKPPLKLPYNKGEDPYTAANTFISKHSLPAVYLDQVVEFILKNSGESTPMQVDSNYVDPFTGASRYTPASGPSTLGNAGANVDPFTGASSYSTAQGRSATSVSSSSSSGNADPFTGASSYTTTSSTERGYFPHNTYIKFDSGDPNLIKKKIKEFNQNVSEGVGKLEDESIETVVTLCTEPCTDLKKLDILFKLLEWPSKMIFPVIDVARLAVRNNVNNELIASKGNGMIINKLKSFICKDCTISNNTLVGFRMLSNLFLHQTGEELIFINRIELLECVTTLSLNNKNIEIGMATFLLNFTILTFKKSDEVGLVLLASVLPDIILNLHDAEAQFRALVALGTLITNLNTQKLEIKVKIMENTSFVTKLRELSSLSGNEVERKRMKCAEQVSKVLLN